jgi:pilus assembly protein CpaD
MQTVRTMIAGRRFVAGSALRAGFVAAAALLVCACTTDQRTTGAPDTPPDYRLRHPITISEANRTFELFIGANRGSLMPEQRAELLAFAQSWRNEATGGVVVDLPTHTANERAAADTMPEIRSILAVSGVPPRNITVRRYRPPEQALAPVRITYPKIVANAGPCGLWPQDIGPSYNRDYFENQPYWNFGCSIQHNLAVMVENPADIVQPRSETPPYEPRRETVVDKYRQGTSTATQYPNTNAGKISNVGQ